MLLCVKTLKKMVKQKKIEYKQFFFNSLSDNMNKNPKEYWNILKSFKKKSNEQENIPEILKDESVVIEHFQKQGNPSHFNSNFKKEIENQFKTMEEVMMYKAESDSTIAYKEIKKAIFDLNKGKSAGPDRILNEVIKYTNPVMINSYMKIFNVILKTEIYPKSRKESLQSPFINQEIKMTPIITDKLSTKNL
jgi:hypothetical protein